MSESSNPKSASMSGISRFWWIAVLLHCAIWTLLPGLLHSGYKPDVIEQLFIGREWVPASSRHPALPAILLELTNLATARAFLSPFLVSQLCALATVWGVWRLGRSVLAPIPALVASLSMLLYWYFTVESTKYNQNLPYIAFWTLSIVFVYASLRTNKAGHWFATGICIGLGMFSKISMILLVFSIVVYFVFDPKARKTWKTAGPWISTLSAFLVFLPIPIWAFFKRDLTAPEYIYHPDDLSLLRSAWMVLRFLLSQIGILLFPLLLLLPILRLPLTKRTDLSPDQRECFRFLGAMIVLPLLLHAFCGLLYLEDMNVDYGAPIWPTLGVWILLCFQDRSEMNNESSATGRRPLFRLGTLLVLIEAVFIVAFIVQSCFSPQLLGKPRRFHFPMKPLGAACEKIWAEQAGGRCPYVTGDWWLAGNAAEGMRPSPSVHAIGAFENMDFDDSPTIWSSDMDVNRDGGLVLWNLKHYEGDTPQTLFAHFPKAVVLDPLVIPYEHFDAPPVEIGIAIVKPERSISKDERSDPLAE